MSARSFEQLQASAVKWVNEKYNGVWPGTDALGKYLHCRRQTAAEIKRTALGVTALPNQPMKEPGVVPVANAEKPTLTETSEVTGDKWTLTLPKTNIHTLEELIA